jgi:hypothetical protein
MRRTVFSLAAIIVTENNTAAASMNKFFINSDLFLNIGCKGTQFLWNMQQEIA